MRWCQCQLWCRADGAFCSAGNRFQCAYLAEPWGGVNASSDVGQMRHFFPQEPVSVCLLCRAMRWCQCQLWCRADGAFCSAGNRFQCAYLAEPWGGNNASSDVGQMEHSVPQEPVTICLPCKAMRWCQCQLWCRACGAFCSSGTCYNLSTLQSHEVVSMPALM